MLDRWIVTNVPHLNPAYIFVDTFHCTQVFRNCLSKNYAEFHDLDAQNKHNSEYKDPFWITYLEAH